MDRAALLIARILKILDLVEEGNLRLFGVSQHAGVCQLKVLDIIDRLRPEPMGLNIGDIGHGPPSGHEKKHDSSGKCPPIGPQPTAQTCFQCSTAPTTQERHNKLHTSDPTSVPLQTYPKFWDRRGAQWLPGIYSASARNQIYGADYVKEASVGQDPFAAPRSKKGICPHYSMTLVAQLSRLEREKLKPTPPRVDVFSQAENSAPCHTVFLESHRMTQRSGAS